MSRKYKRGQRAFGQQPGRQNDDFWDKNVIKLEEPAMGKVILVRPVGGILTVGIHYIKFISPKDGQEKGFQIQCPNWNLVEQEDIDNGCPLCRDFHWNLPIEQKKYEFLKMPQKYRYLFHAFHVSNIKQKREPVFGCIETHALGLKAIEEAMLVKGNPPDDPEHGYCLNWLCTKPQSKQFKKDIKFSAGDSLPVRELKDGVWGIKVDNRKIKGAEQDLLEVIPAPPTAQELEKKLSDLGLYSLLERVVGGSGRKVSSQSDDDPDSDTDWEDGTENSQDDAGDEETVGPDDDDWGAEDDAGEPQADAEDDDWSGEEDDVSPDGDDDSNDWDESPEPEPEPPPKKKGGKKAGKKGGKKTASKKAAKPKPESDPDDDDWEDDDWD